MHDDTFSYRETLVFSVFIQIWMVWRKIEAKVLVLDWSESQREHILLRYDSVTVIVSIMLILHVDLQWRI